MLLVGVGVLEALALSAFPLRGLVRRILHFHRTTG